jgi:hypothetical protein
MKFPHIFENVAALAWVVVSLVATPAVTTQTIISNETLVSTTLIVNTKDAKAICRTTGCRAKTAMFAPINVTCPAATGKTCTFHIFLDAKASFGDSCNLCQGGGADYFQFLVDDAPPTIGPTDARGFYRFAQNIVGFAGNELRESFPASVVATVTNSTSNNHTVALNVACKSTTAGGCQTTAHASTLRVDVFEP